MNGTSYQNNFRLGILKARHEFNSKTPQGVMSLIDRHRRGLPWGDREPEQIVIHRIMLFLYNE